MSWRLDTTLGMVCYQIGQGRRQPTRERRTPYQKPWGRQLETTSLYFSLDTTWIVLLYWKITA